MTGFTGTSDSGLGGASTAAPQTDSGTAPSPSKKTGSRTLVIAVLIAVVLVLAALGTAFVLGAFKTSTASSQSGTGHQTLHAVEISPLSVSLGFSRSQEFAASAINTNGTTITSGVSFVWSPAPSSMGTLNRTSGASVTLTSGDMNITGDVSVVGSFGGISKSATASVVVSSSGGSGIPSISYFASVPSNITLGSSTTLEVTASGGSPPLSYSYSALPAGCESANTTELACTPTVSGTFDPAVTVTDSLGHSVAATAVLIVQGKSPYVQGSLVYQPSGVNYTESQSSGTGIVTATDGSEYRVVLPAGFSLSTPVAIAGSFQLAADPSLPGYNDITALVPSAPVSTLSPNAEVNVSLNSVGVAAANLTLGLSVLTSDPVAYLALGTYPTFFSNVTLQGVDLNVSTLGSILNVNVTWLTGLVASIDPNLPTSFSQVVVVNQSIWLPDAREFTGQAQVVITPANVSEFISSISSSQGSADGSMITAALNELDEEFVAVCNATPGHVDYSFLLAPIQLTRASLAGLVTLDAEESYLSVSLVLGNNPNITAFGTPVRAFVGVTWDKNPVSESGYTPSSVSDLWQVSTEHAVTLQAPAIGISLYDVGNALQGMGYAEAQYVMDLATLQNPAVFVLVDPSVVQNPNITASFSSYAVAIVPNDELALQSSVSLYLTLNGVVYNTSYYLGVCSSTNLPACPLFVADSISFGHPRAYLPYQLGALSSPTFVQTTGFLAGTTMKTVNQDMGDYSELAQDSPVDVGVYDLGYSSGSVGYNMPAVELTWGPGPTLNVTHNLTQGLYVPASSGEAAWYLLTYASYLPGSGLGLEVISALQSYVENVRQFVYSDVLNGSLPVPGILIMMDLWANSSSGSAFALASSLAAVPSGCPGGLNNCIVANVSLSANSGLYINPASLGLVIDLTGPTTISQGLATNCVDTFSFFPACLPPNPLPIPGLVNCLGVGLCALSPYHVVNVTSYFCYDTGILPTCVIPDLLTLSSGSYTASYLLLWGGLAGTQVAATPSFPLTLS